MTARRIAIPASFFSMVLGLAGLGNDWRQAARAWGLPAWTGEAVMVVAAAVWATLLVLYALKWIHSRPAALAEIAHPIQCCFAVLLPVTTMLIGLAAAPYSHGLAVALCAIGAVGALLFGVWRHGGLWRGGRSVGETTPVLYLPTVAANLVSAIAAGALGWPELGQLFLGAGVLAWLALESIIIGRLLTGEEMPAALRPTLGIQTAPAAVTLLAYASVTEGPPDLVAHMLLGYAVLQMLIAIRLTPWIRQPFTPGYWAYTFGTTAIAAATIRYVDRGADVVFATAAPVLFVAANVIVVGLFARTVLAALQGKLLPAGAPAPAKASAPHLA